MDEMHESAFSVRSVPALYSVIRIRVYDSIFAGFATTYVHLVRPNQGAILVTNLASPSFLSLHVT
jgi:hypothetical protein